MKQAVVKSCEACGGWCCRAILISREIIEAATRGVYEFWSEITLEEAGKINPFLPKLQNPTDNSYYICSHFKSGLCDFYDERPDTCSGYPYYEHGIEELVTNPSAFYVPWCYYRTEVLEFLGREYDILEDGETCRQRYLEILKEDPKLAQEFLNPQNLLVSKRRKSSKGGTQGKSQTQQ